MYALANNDIVIGRAESINDDAQDFLIPEKLLACSDDVLRVLDGEVIDASALKTFYIDDFGIKHVVSNDAWAKLDCKFSDLLVKVDGAWEVQSSSAKLNTLRKQVKNQVDIKAEQLRSGSVTAGVGQSLAYQLKYEEAKEVFEANGVVNPSDYPMLAAEIGVTGKDVEEVALAVIDARKTTKESLAKIEHIRLTAKKAIDAASTEKKMYQVLDGIDWSL